MSGPGVGGGYARPGAVIPKSILADKSHISYHPMAESNSLRVTFAQTTTLGQKPSVVGNANPSGEPGPVNLAKAIAEITNNKQGSSGGDEAASSVPNKQSNYNPASSSENWRKNYQSSLGKQKSSSSKSTLGMLLSEIKSDSTASSGKKSKTNTQASNAKSKLRNKKLSRKPTNKNVSSNMTFRKKKTKKRKKSTIAEDKLEEELTKPVKLSDEYAQELSKITQIIKAVTSSEGTNSKESGSSSTANSARGNAPTSFYSYSGGLLGLTSNTTTTTHNAHDSTAVKTQHPRRPLSGDELKQLLKSITRVVSLHQLPVDAGIPAGSRPGSAQESAAKAPPVGLGLNDTSKILREAGAATAAAAAPPNGTVLGISNSITSSISSKKVRKKRKKFVHKRVKYPLQIEGSPSEPMHKERPRRTKSGEAAQDVLSKRKSITGGKGGAVRVKSKTNRPSKKGSKLQKDDDDRSSVSSLERDPVKQAAFLRKYFEESVRLANKKSSEVLPQSEIKSSDINLAPASNNVDNSSASKRKPKPKASSVTK